ncbi:MAG TPA: glycosyltransferase [Urbifossiella sp.]|nr:glycosyltransferase [Urbifossiella sp.]
MRVLFAAARPCYPLFLGGAEISAHETLLALGRSGHECRALGQVTAGLDDLSDWMAAHRADAAVLRRPIPGHAEPLVERCEVTLDVGYRVLLTLHADFVGCVRRTLAEFRPDLVLTQLDGSEAVAHAALRHGARVLHTVRDLNNPHNFLPFLSGRTRGAGMTVLANSEYVRARLRERWGVEAAVLYPAVDVGRFRPPAPGGGAAVMVNPVRSKGGEIVRHLIKGLPDQPFVLVEGWSRLRPDDWPYPNARLVRRRHDIEVVLAEATVVLVPSQEEEGFGRVVVEGQAAGVPVLCSRHSGLIESHGDGDGMVAEYREPAAWLEALTAVLRDPIRRADMCRHGRANCHRFTRERHGRALEARLS